MKFTARGIEGRVLLWAAVGQTLRLGLPLVLLTIGSFARDPKVYDVGHSFIFFPSGGARTLARWPNRGRLFTEPKKVLLATLGKTVAKFQYTVS